MGRVLLVGRENKTVDSARHELTRRGHECVVVNALAKIAGALEQGPFDIIALSTNVAGSQLDRALREISLGGVRPHILVVASPSRPVAADDLRRWGVSDVMTEEGDFVSRLGGRVDALLAVAEPEIAGTVDQNARVRAVLRTQLEITSDGVVVGDSNGRIVHFNATFLDLWNLPRKLVSNGDLQSVLRTCFESTKQGLRDLETVLENPVVEVVGQRIELRGGWVLEWSSYPVRLHDNTAIGRVFAFRDLTAQIAAEEQVRFQASLLEEVPSAIIATTTKGTVRYWNRFAEMLHGWSSAEVSGKDIKDILFTKEQVKLARKAIENLESTGRWDGEVQLKRKDGSTFPGLLTLTRFDGVRGQPALVVGVVMDLTERRGLEARLLQAQKMEAVGTLAGGLAHDFNNLLTGVLGSAGLARELPQLDPAVAELMEMIERAALRGRDLCTQLLSFSRAEKPKVAAINPLDFIEEVAKIVERTFPREVRLRVEIDDDIPPILADRGQINQALMNLLVNARDAMEGGGSLVIRATISKGMPADLLFVAEPDERRYVRLEVADSGSGMSSEVVSRMFEPFFTTKASGKGTGLGLPMVFSIARAHGGSIRVWSRPNKGSTFALFLPVSEGLEAPEPHAGEIRPSGELESFSGSERILLVDDEAIVRNVGARILRQFGYDTIEAANGLEALQILERERDNISAVLLDMIMPEMEGPEVYRRMRSKGVDVPVLLCSAFRVADTVDDLLEEGAAGFVQKPYRLQELLPALRAILDGWAVRR